MSVKIEGGAKQTGSFDKAVGSIYAGQAGERKSSATIFRTGASN